MQTAASMPHCGNQNGIGSPAITFEPAGRLPYIKRNKEKMLPSTRFRGCEQEGNGYAGLDAAFDH
jgi:hypothetical protein